MSSASKIPHFSLTITELYAVIIPCRLVITYRSACCESVPLKKEISTPVRNADLSRERIIRLISAVFSVKQTGRNQKSDLIIPTWLIWIFRIDILPFIDDRAALRRRFCRLIDDRCRRFRRFLFCFWFCNSGRLMLFVFARL